MFLNYEIFPIFLLYNCPLFWEEITIAYKGELIQQKYGVTVIPAVIVISPDGKIIYTLAGYKNDLELTLKELIAHYNR